MFGLFQNKQGKMLSAETSRTIINAQTNLSIKKKTNYRKKCN